jgi:hypothetical protein
VAKVTVCPSAGERDTALLYLAGKLAEDEAQAFEEHYFSCVECREDVERGSELRSTLGKPPVVPRTNARSAVRAWLPLAAAAVLAFAGVGVWQMTRRSPEEADRRVMRSTATGVLDVGVVAGSSGAIELSWPPHPDAASYVVQVLAPDDAGVWKTRTSEPRLTIASGILPAPERARGLRVEVEAFDSMGQEVAKSELLPLPQR